jgi:hypothetical protein
MFAGNYSKMTAFAIVKAYGMEKGRMSFLLPTVSILGGYTVWAGKIVLFLLRKGLLKANGVHVEEKRSDSSCSEIIGK